MNFRRLPIDGPIEVLPKKHRDHRGYFSEIFRADVFHEHVGEANFVQENESLSIHSGTIRGIHFQTHPAAQGKLVRCVSGSLYDVVVDLRHDSATFGRWLGIKLSSETGNQVWIPAGFGHAFCTLEPNSVVSYRVTSYYSPENDKGVAWNDPEIAIEWPDVADPESLSQKDRNQPLLAELPYYFSVKDC